MTLKELRESHALRQVDVAAKLRVAVQTVSDWERGAKTPRLVHIGDLAKLYQITVAEVNQAINETQKQAQSE
jgi:transcriptional regulator with XRE-family HTH domain